MKKRTKLSKKSYLDRTTKAESPNVVRSPPQIPKADQRKNETSLTKIALNFKIIFSRRLSLQKMVNSEEGEEGILFDFLLFIKIYGGKMKSHDLKML